MRQTKPKYSKDFSRVRAGGSLNPGVSYGEARGRAKTLPFVSQPFTGETSKEPLLVYLDSLEDGINALAYWGDNKPLRKRWKRYCYRHLNLIRDGLYLKLIWEELCK